MSTEHVETDRSEPRAVLAVPTAGSRFAIVWVGQFVAVTGLTVVNFAAAYFTYRHDYSLLVLGIMFALPFVPFLVASVLAGALIDRWGPRRGLLVSNVGGLLLALSLVIPLVTGSFSVWHGFVIITAVPILKALLLPAFEASVSFLVPKRHIGRANGTRMLVNGTGAVLGPVAAGLLLQSVGIGVIGVLGVVALALAVMTLFLVRFGRAPRPDTPAPGLTGLLHDCAEAWRYTLARPGLPALMAFFGVLSFGIGFVEVLLPGMVSAFAAEPDLVTVLVIGMAGMAVTGIVVTVWGGPRRHVAGLVGFSLVFAAAMILGALRPDVTLIAIAAFVFLGTTSILVGAIHTVLNLKVEPHMLGRVMGYKNVVYAGVLIVGNVAAGAASGALQPLTVGLGLGPGREFALAMLLGGVLVAACAVVAYRYPPLRRLDERLPDRTPEDLAAEKVPR